MARIYVKIDDQPVGQLDFTVDGIRESSTFTYDPEWVVSADGFDLSPSIKRAHYISSEVKDGNVSPLVMPIADSAPDSWGKAVIKAAHGGRYMTDFQYLCAVDDFLRSGALQFYETAADGALPIAQPRKGHQAWSVPRLFELEMLITEARALEKDPAHYRENRAHMLGGEMLLNAAGSLGGARPKVNMRDEDGSIWIAKLPKVADEYDMARAEVLAMRLAAELGMEVAQTKPFTVANQFPVALVKRFDRRLRQDGRYGRRHMITAQTFMGIPGTGASDYVSIVDMMMAHIAADHIKGDLLELWTRMAYSVLIQNTDDHLRNHAFLMTREGWRLSPAYDINPDPTPGTTLKTAISEEHGYDLNINAVIDAAPYFEISHVNARLGLLEMAEFILGRWRNLAAELRMDARTIRAIAPAFESAQVRAAARLRPSI